MAAVRKNIFEELDRVKNLIQIRFPEADIRDWCTFLSKLGTYHYHKKKYLLLGNDKAIYNLLIENSYNPFTVYRWSLLERIPEEIKFQLKNHYLSQKSALQSAVERRKTTNTKIQVDIRELGLQLIRGM